jgi:hypothetical protein
MGLFSRRPGRHGRHAAGHPRPPLSQRSAAATELASRASRAPIAAPPTVVLGFRDGSELPLGTDSPYAQQLRGVADRLING